jgi:hypothetical protein
MVPLTEHLSPVDLEGQGYPFVQNHPFMIRSIALAHLRTTTFQRKNLSAPFDQTPCSNTAAAEALLYLQSSHIQLNAPSRQQAGFQIKLYSSVGLNQHDSLEGTLTQCSKCNPTPEQRGSSSSPTMLIQTNSDSMVKKNAKG